MNHKCTIQPCPACQGTGVVKVRTIADSIADYKATPESAKESIRRAYGLLIDTGLPIEFDI